MSVGCYILVGLSVSLSAHHAFLVQSSQRPPKSGPAVLTRFLLLFLLGFALVFISFWLTRGPKHGSARSIEGWNSVGRTSCRRRTVVFHTSDRSPFPTAVRALDLSGQTNS